MNNSIKNYSLRRESTFINANDFRDNSFNYETSSSNSDFSYNYESPLISRRILNINDDNRLIAIREDSQENIGSNIVTPKNTEMAYKMNSSKLINFNYHHLFKKKKSSQFKKIKTLKTLNKNNLFNDHLISKESINIKNKKRKSENEIDLNNLYNNNYFSSIFSDEEIIKDNILNYNVKISNDLKKRKSKSLNPIDNDKINEFFKFKSNKDINFLKNDESSKIIKCKMKKCEDIKKIDKNIIIISECDK